METMIQFFTTLLDLWLDAAVWLILGLMIAGIFHVVMKSDKLAPHMKGEGLWPAIKAALFGMPLPLCSCGVIPAAVSLRKGGASKSATTAFLISTPETGIDSISISYALLGPFMAIIRPIAATTSAITAAGLVLLTDKNQSQVTPVATKSSCCSGCGCNSKSSPSRAEKPTSLMTQLWQGQRYAFTELIEDLALWLIVGLLVSAAAMTFFSSETLADISKGPWAMLAMALIGVPMYICASASTPLAAGLMLSGVSPGAVLVFLLCGPATNIATLGVVRKELGNRALWSYLIGVIAVAIGFGYLTNYLVDTLSIDMSVQISSSNHLLPLWLSSLCGAFLAYMVLREFIVKFRKTRAKPNVGLESPNVNH
jgi:uncharacterized membrane protein YraQ (UPF0718 family)